MSNSQHEMLDEISCYQQSKAINQLSFELNSLHNNLNLKQKSFSVYVQESKKQNIKSLFRQDPSHNLQDHIQQNKIDVFSEIQSNNESNESLFQSGNQLFDKKCDIQRQSAKGRICAKPQKESKQSKRESYSNNISHFEQFNQNRIMQILKGKSNKVTQSNKNLKNKSSRNNSKSHNQISRVAKLSSHFSISSSVKIIESMAQQKPEKSYSKNSLDSAPSKSNDKLKYQFKCNDKRRVKTDYSINKNIRTDQNPSKNSYNKNYQKQIKTDYDEIKEPYLIVEEVSESEKNSLQCTFKPKLGRVETKSLESKPFFTKEKLFKQNTDNLIKEVVKSNKNHFEGNVLKENKNRQNSVPQKKQGKCKQQNVATDGHMDVASRNQIWYEQKQKKIDQKRKQCEDQKRRKQSLTFHPSINCNKKIEQSLILKQKDKSFNCFQRLSNAKKKFSVVSFKKNDNEINSKSRANQSVIKQVSSLITISQVPEQSKLKGKVMKKQTYDEAVKQLHFKIMKMNI